MSSGNARASTSLSPCVISSVSIVDPVMKRENCHNSAARAFEKRNRWLESG